MCSEKATSTYTEEEPAFGAEHLTRQVNCATKVHVACMSSGVKEEPGHNMHILSGHTLPYPSSHVKEEPVSGGGEDLPSPDRCTPTDGLHHHPLTRIKEEPAELGNLPSPDMYTLVDHRQQHSTTPIKKEPQSHEEGPSAVTNTPTPSDHTSQYLSADIKEEALLRDGENTGEPVMYTSTDHTQHPSANIKEELDSCDQGSLVEPIIYTPRDYTLHCLSTRVKEESYDISLDSSEIRPHSGHTHHHPSSHAKNKPTYYVGGPLRNVDIHTQNASSFDEETDSCDEADFTDLYPTQDQTPVSVGVQHVTGGVGLQKDGLSVSAYHQTTQSADFTFKCLDCEACFSSKSDFEEHLTLHRGKKTHVCPHCGKCFSYQSQLLIHERTHTGEKPFTCSECGKCFNQYVHLAIHLMSHTGEKPYVCSECGKSFNRKTTLTIHQRIHTGEKPFHCSQCGKYFSTSSNLIKHQRVHTGEKPYSCSQCGEFFVHYTQLIRHQANHTAEKPFSCPECGKAFSQKAQFLRHEKFHKADNTYSCSECKQCFKQYKDLLVHQSAHAGPNPFTCQACGKPLDNKCIQNFHSGEKPFSCSECSKTFGFIKQVHVNAKSCPEGGERLDKGTQLESSPAGCREETLSCSVSGEPCGERNDSQIMQNGQFI
ncbi:hypothetical protein GDO78_016945 [Eleutherodactylus coqui]|uniref:C2H2-type domain-containing protein n=1 Tax=Eleutherodactylus coqui TaxID=57060 RepID=A0A8J6B1I0_ELECQ|nr:hypothetical protein GDO78_016945 [Eleutherodactylus coqui]KAG9461414.1 hypothetical protein GDO78_016945 [Eleutherodactylus coqui]KAG9461415.1 hypothetical protein GDO78_016945 [Eleutherodactylus coqui]